MRQALVAVLALGAISGCAWFDGDEPDTTVGENEEFYRTTDPVTGERVNTDSPYRTAHGGRTYYFNSEDSMRRFTENPSAYVDNDGRVRAEWERERRDVR